MQQFKLTIAKRARSSKALVAMLFVNVEGVAHKTKVAEFPGTETGMFALSRLLEGLQYDVSERGVIVDGFFGPTSNDFDDNIEAERIAREFNILQTADRLYLRPEGC